MANPNLELLTDAAKLLEPLLGELVFVGGCATALLITDKAAADVRPTLDVDAIAEITSYAGYNTFSERLKKLGFQEDTREDAPRCRWRQETTTLDVMPLDPKVLGFSNSWYRPAMEHSEERELENGLKIRLVAPVYFCASKLEAFERRGNDDFAGSRDLEDIIAVVDGENYCDPGGSICSRWPSVNDSADLVAFLTKFAAVNLFKQASCVFPQDAAKVRISKRERTQN